MSSHARREILHRLKNIRDDRTLRYAAIVAAATVAIVWHVVTPTTYELDGSKCKEFSTYTVICPKNADFQR
jgi:hypothetical protein